MSIKINSPQYNQETIERAAVAISQATAFLFTAGAGMGVDSGLPDFRGDHGFWKAYPSLYGYSFSDMANPAWFDSDPRLAWGFYGHRLNLYRSVVPHNGFSILKKWSKNRPYFIFTSNVDGQFQKAGFSETSIHECHGSIHWLQHRNPNVKGRNIWSAADLNVVIDEQELRVTGAVPMRGGEVIRPNILMFGDWYWLEERSAKQEEYFSQWINNTDISKLVTIEMGAGTSIPSVRNFSSRMNRVSNGTLIRINPRESMGGDIQFDCGALEALEAIEEIL